MISSQFRVSPDPAVERRNGGEEKENADLFRESQLLSLPCASSPHMSQETPQLAQMTDLREKSNHAKPPTRTDFPVIEDGNNRTKDRFFCLQETLSSSQPRQHKIQGKHSSIFPPLFGNMEKENLAIIFFSPSFTRSDTFFSPALTNDRV